MVRVKIFKYEDDKDLEEKVNNFLANHHLRLDEIEFMNNNGIFALIYEKKKRYVRAPFPGRTPGDIIEK